MPIKIDRLMKQFFEIATIGQQPNGGVTRLGGSVQHKKAAERLTDMMQKAGLAVRVDPVGNVFGRRNGSDPTLPCIAIGSHLDTVPNGGLYDGCLGVMTAMECIHALNDDGIITRNPIEIVAFNYEEGNELGGTFGSAALMGTALHSGSIPHLSLYGLTEQTVNDCRIDPTRYQSFIELHIEQGGMLEQEGLDIGIVEGIVGITRYRIDITGEANHAGTTPMALRRDAVLAGAKLISKMEELAKQYPHPFVFTVGKIEVSPGVVNVVPGAVTLYLEIRDLNAQPIDRFVKQLREYSAELTRWEFLFEKTVDKPSVRLNSGIVNFLHQGCEELGFLRRSIASGAGHDAKVLAPFLPSGLIFLPSCGGISHNPAERTEVKAIHKGALLMLDCLLRQDAANRGKSNG